MAQAEQTDRSIVLAQALIIGLVIIGIVVSIIVGLLTLTKSKSTQVREALDSAEIAGLDQFNNNTTTGAEILSLIQQKQESNFGVIVVTEQQKLIKNGTNYIKPLGDGSSVQHGNYVVSISTKIPNKLPSEGSHEINEGDWDELPYIESKFASDTKPAIVNLKEAKTPGNEKEIIETAKYQCKLIANSGRVIGVICLHNKIFTGKKSNKIGQ